MEYIKILPRTQKRTFEFYSVDKEGVETVLARKKLIHPDRCKLYKKLEDEGFKDRREYGFREVE